MTRSLDSRAPLPLVLLLVALVLAVGLVGVRLAQAGDPGGAGDAEADTGDAVTSLFRVEGMTCDGCEAGVEISVEKLDGVAAVEASYAEGAATVTYDPAKTTPEAIVAAIEALGYTAELAEEAGGDDGPRDGEES